MEKQFRIGNLIEKIHTDYGRSLIEIDVEDLEIMQLGLENISYHQIPLTEEWLIKFGCKENFVFHIGKDSGSLWDIQVLTNHKNEVWAYNQEGEMVCFLATCEYVHTFQNLYFALTGQELTLKQPPIPQ